MKTFVLTIMLLAASVVQAAQIETQFKDGSRVHGVGDTFFSRETPKICYRGSTEQICRDLKSSVFRANIDLVNQGSDERIKLIACAQTQNQTLFAYALQVRSPRAHEKEIELRKTIYVRACN